jgi:hypothetical protein
MGHPPPDGFIWLKSLTRANRQAPAHLRKDSRYSRSE